MAAQLGFASTPARKGRLVQPQPANGGVPLRKVEVVGLVACVPEVTELIADVPPAGVVVLVVAVPKVVGRIVVVPPVLLSECCGGDTRSAGGLAKSRTCVGLILAGTGSWSSFEGGVSPWKISRKGSRRGSSSSVAAGAPSLSSRRRPFFSFFPFFCFFALGGGGKGGGGGGCCWTPLTKSLRKLALL